MCDLAVGPQQLRFFPESEMGQMGVAAYQQIRQEVPESRDPAVRGYVNCVAQAVTGALPEGDQQQWTVTVFDDPQANAFALPGGNVGVYAGLLQVARNQDQLATVIGHEIAHVLAAHSNERVSTSYATQTGLQIIEALQGGPTAQNQQLMALLGVGAQLGVILPFSRTQEREADLLGLDVMQGRLRPAPECQPVGKHERKRRSRCAGIPLHPPVARHADQRFA